MRKSLLLSFASILIFTALSSCGVSRQEYNNLKTQLGQAQASIVVLQNQLDQDQQTIAQDSERIAELFAERNQAQDDLAGLQYQFSDAKDYLAKNEALWSGRNIFVNASKTVNVKIGEEFIIAYDLDSEWFIVSENEFHDDTMVAFLGLRAAPYPPSFSTIGSSLQAIHGIAWFTFKAIKPGDTHITVNHVGHLTLGVENPETFDVVIIA